MKNGRKRPRFTPFTAGIKPFYSRFRPYKTSFSTVGIIDLGYYFFFYSENTENEQSEENVSYNEDQQDDKASTSTEECYPDDYFDALPEVNRSLLRIFN